ncbi:MAG: YihY/virulence factor BrkB family protein [Alphaproteobacteria bacterium]
MLAVHLRLYWRVLKEAAFAFSADRAGTMGAAIAFYTIFSLAPLLVLIIAVAGIVWGDDAARGAVDEQLQDIVGAESAGAVQALVQHAADIGTGLVAMALGLLTMMVAATTVFGQIQDALNVIWKVQPSSRSGAWSLLRTRLISLALIFCLGMLLLLSLVVNATLAGFSGTLNEMVPFMGTILQVVNFLVSFAILTTLFALVYRLLPDTPIGWRDVWLGGAVSALLFTIGRQLVSLYLGHTGAASAYGAAGSLIVVLLWVYYSAQIFLFGAEITRAYASLR